MPEVPQKNIIIDEPSPDDQTTRLQELEQRYHALEVQNLELWGKLAGLQQELTERKQTEEALWKNAAQLRLITDAVPGLIAYVDHEQRYQFINATYEVWFGVPRDQIVGHTIAEILGRENYKQVQPYIERALAGERVTYEHSLTYRGVDDKTVQTIYEPDVGSDGQVAGFYVLVTDISERKQVEAALAESEARFRTLANVAPSMVWMAAPDGTIIFANERWFQYVGITPEQNAQHWPELVLHPDDMERCVAQWTQALQTGSEYEIEVRNRRYDGEYRWFLTRAVPVRNSEGLITSWFGTTTDIHDRKQAEDALRHSQEQLQAIIDNAGAVICLKDLQGHYLMVNRLYEQLCGLPQEQVLGKTDHDCCFPQELADTYRDHDQQVLAAKQAMQFEETALIDGEPRNYLATKFPLFDDAGEPYAICGISTDITDHKQVELALRESEARFRMMADTAPVLIWMSGPDKQRTYFNKPWLDFTGRTMEQELGFGWAERVHADDYQRCLGTYTTAIDARRPVEMEYRLRRHDGEYRWVLDQAVPRFEGDQFVGYIGSCIDIHERKRAELAERVLAAAGKVLASSLDPVVRLSNVAQLAVPDLADWCAVDVFEEDWSVHHVTVAHVDPAKVELAYELQRRFPPRREILMKVALPWQKGQSQLYPEITEVMLEEGAHDAEHFRILRDLNLRSAMVVPLVARERVLGIIAFFWAESGHHYDEQDLALAEELARRAAIALDNARIYEAEQRARRAAEQIAGRIAGLQEATAALSVALTPAEVVDVIIRQSTSVLAASGGAVMLLTEDGASLEIIQSTGYAESTITIFQRFPLTASIPASDAVRSGEPVWLRSHQEFEQRYPHLASTRPADSRTEAVAVIPLFLEGRALGAMTVSFNEVRDFSLEDKDFLETLAGLCAQALERAHLYETERLARAEAETAGQRLSLLAVASEVLIASSEPRAALVNLARLLVPTLADWCVVDVIGEDNLIHRLVVVHRDPAKAELANELQHRYPILDPHGEHTIARTMRQGYSWLDPEVSDSRLAAEARDAEHLRLLLGLGFAAEMVVPLTARGRTLGALTLVRTSLERPYDQQDLSLAEELARRATVAVDNARLYEAEQAARQVAEQAAERVASLQSVTVALARALTPRQVSKVIIQALKVVQADAGLVALVDARGEHLERMHYFGYPATTANQHLVPLSAPRPLAETVSKGEAIYIESAEALARRYPESAAEELGDYQALVTLPLRVRGRVLGAIRLSFVQARTFTEEERTFMITLARQCAQALDRARLYEAERRARAEAEAAQQSLALLAEVRERNRLAQELHDNVAQAIGYLNLKVSMTDGLLNSDRFDEARANLRELKQIVGETYTDIRGEIFNLRATPSGDIDFLETLHRYVDKYRRFYQLDIQLILAAEESLFNFPKEVSIALIRTIQEVLINVRKHAQVDHALIRLGQEADELSILIEDKGQGFELDQATAEKVASSYGLKIMRERIEGVGGRLAVESTPGQGTRVSLFYPKGTKAEP